ncbi:hypothetical protein ACFQL3_06500 [Natronoarchaeum sp. GCM10025321]|uniref:hypothetical protein n=1 Tax=Natronoarchaeum sp. GCM10025321 TaxID=3252684 RepID=UPI0036211A66
MPGPSDGPWPDRAETVDRPATLTVLGVDRGDDGLPETLRDAVPEDADALFTDRDGTVLSRRDRWRAYGLNPALALLGIPAAIAVLSDYASYGTTSREFDRQAVDAVADERGLPVESVGRSPLTAVDTVSLPWHLGGWVVTLVLLLAAIYGLVAPGLGGVVFCVAAVALASAYVLAYLGATIESESARLFETIRRGVEEQSYDHPVAVVRRRHVPSLTDHAKEARIRTQEWTLSPTTDPDWVPE